MRRCPNPLVSKKRVPGAWAAMALPSVTGTSLSSWSWITKVEISDSVTQRLMEMDSMERPATFSIRFYKRLLTAGAIWN